MSSMNFSGRIERPWDNHLLTTTIIIGHVNSDSARLWFRCEKPGAYRIVLATAPLVDCSDNDPLVLDPVANSWAIASQNGVILNVRVSEEIVVQRDAQDNVGVLTFTNLSADTRHYLAIASVRPGEAARLIWGTRKQSSFRTMLDLGKNPDKIVLGLCSCNLPFSGTGAGNVKTDNWRHFEQELQFRAANAVLMTGDQVYTDGDKRFSIWKYLGDHLDQKPSLEDMISWYREIYRGYWGFEYIQSILRNYPTYKIWDDHEIVDGWGSREIKDLADDLSRWLRNDDEKVNVEMVNQMWEAARATYLLYQHATNPPVPPRNDQALDYTLAFSLCDIFVMDGRSCRQWTDAANYSHQNPVLGQGQIKRLIAWAGDQGKLRADLAPICLVSAVPFVHLGDAIAGALAWSNVMGSRDDVQDHWAHASHAQEFALIVDSLFKAADKSGRPLLIISGDVHIGTAFRLKHDAYPEVNAWQITSSAIANATLGDIPRYILRSAVSRRGKTHNVLHYECHDIFPYDNFGILTIRQGESAGVLETYVDLIGENGDQASIGRRIKIS